MSQLDEFDNFNIEEIKDMFSINIKNQTVLNAYPEQFLVIRKQLIQWLTQICSKCYFKPETLHRAISLYDLLISKTKTSKDKVLLHNLKISIIACLSISTKLNEHFANYLQFFTDTVLNVSLSSTSSVSFTVSDLSSKELEIPKLIDYNVNSPNVYHFNAIFLKICLSQFQSDLPKNNFLELNKQILNEFIATNYCITMSPLNSAIIVLNETLRQFMNINELNSKLCQGIIINTLTNFIEENKALKKCMTFPHKTNQLSYHIIPNLL